MTETTTFLEEAETIESRMNRKQSARMTRKQSASAAGDDQQESIVDLGSREGGREDLAISETRKGGSLNDIDQTKESTIASPHCSTERGSRSGETPPLFPTILHQMLQEAENEHNEHIVGWDTDGLSFKIHKPNELAGTIMPRYFKNQTKFRSFQRQVRRSYCIVLYCCFAFSVFETHSSVFSWGVVAVVSIPILESTSWPRKRGVHSPKVLQAEQKALPGDDSQETESYIWAA